MVWNLGGNAKNAGSQGHDVQNQDENSDVAVEMNRKAIEIINSESGEK